MKPASNPEPLPSPLPVPPLRLRRRRADSHAGVRLPLGEVAGEAQIRDAHVAVLVQQDVGRLQVAVHDEPPVHVLQTWRQSPGVSHRFTGS